jgi:hypothetical protein
MFFFLGVGLAGLVLIPSHQLPRKNSHLPTSTRKFPMSSNYDALLAQLDEQSFDPPWRPEVGGTIAGTVTKITNRPASQKGDEYPIVILSTDDGPRAVHCFHRTLRVQLFEAYTLAVGDLLALRYEGKRTSDTGREYHAYRVVHEPKGF